LFRFASSRGNGSKAEKQSRDSEEKKATKKKREKLKKKLLSRRGGGYIIIVVVVVVIAKTGREKKGGEEKKRETQNPSSHPKSGIPSLRFPSLHPSPPSHSIPSPTVEVQRET
jgi:hypothetical protein